MVTPTCCQSSRPLRRPAESIARGLRSLVSTTARSDEDAGAQHRWLVDEGIVLDLAVVTDPDPGTHVCTPTEVATAPNHGRLPYLSEMPNGRAVADECFGIDIGGRH